VLDLKVIQTRMNHPPHQVPERGPCRTKQDPKANEYDCIGRRIANPNAPYNPHFPTPQQRLDSSQTFYMHGQPSGTTSNLGQERPDGSFDMGSMAGTLPSYRPPPQGFGSSQNQQRFPTGAISPALLHQQQLSQLTGQGMTTPGYNTGYPSQFLPSYPPGQQGPSTSSQYMQHQANNPTRSINPSPVQQNYPNTSYFPGQQQPAQPYMFYPAPFGHVSPSPQSFQGWSSAHPSNQTRRLSQSYQQGPSRQQENPMNILGGGFPTQGVLPQSGAVAYGYSASGPYLRPAATQGTIFFLALAHCILLKFHLCSAYQEKLWF